MRILSRRALNQFAVAHADAKGSLDAWYHEVRHAMWDSPADLRARYRSADILPGNRVVFNIKGNKYRLVVQINYAAHIVFIRFLGTHAEYNRIDAEQV